MNQEFEKFLKTEIKKVEKKILQFLSSRKPRSLYEPCRYAIEGGGKRLRPMLVLLTAKSVGGKFKQVYNTAVAVELLHTFTLVHDDIMDNSEKRRGRKTVHNKFDSNTAILSGDSLAALAFESLLKDCSSNSKDVITSFTNGLVKVCEGQGLDKEFEIKERVTLRQYKEMIYKKTAALSEMCCNVSALICKAKKNHVIALTEFGRNLGMAFQIQDDLLDVIGNEKEFGKVVGSDLIEGKKTYLFLRALQSARKKDKNRLLEITRNKGITKAKVQSYIELYKKLGVVDAAKKEIIYYTNKALQYLEQLPNEEGKKLLNTLANFLVERSR